MNIHVWKSPIELGRAAAEYAATILNKCIQENGKARLVLSTGRSQLDTIEALVQMKVDWKRVELFHLDEYIGLPESHPASFRKYIKENFVQKVDIKNVHFVNTEGDVIKRINMLSDEIRKEPIDLALIGIGENAHIAFNDPPADFDTKEAYIIVRLDERCKMQQVREGWFPEIDAVPERAVTMTVQQILQSRTILSCVPFKVKAEAIKSMLENEVTNQIPATILKTHPNVSLFLDEDSASLVNRN